MGPEQRSTIYDVARAANVAPSTVSRAFSRPSRVNALTVQKIRETAAILGYVPNQTARGLSTGRTGNLAMVIPNIANPFFTQFIRVFHQAARDREHSVQLIDTYEDAEEEVRRVEGVLSQVDGVALVSPRMSLEQLRSVTAKGRFVVVNRKLDGLACVWVDSGPALRDVFADLRRFGHESIVYATSGNEQLVAISQLTPVIAGRPHRLEMASGCFVFVDSDEDIHTAIERRVTELAERVRMTKQGCGQFVTQLVETGHLAVEADPDDRRVRRVRRTAKGRRRSRA